MGRTTELRRAIKRQFIPLMESKGFETDFRHMPFNLGFRRITDHGVFVCDIQWEKYGRPRFVLNFGSCSSLGVICHGSEIGPSDVDAAVTPSQGRLSPGRSASVSSWFRQDRTLLQRLWIQTRLKTPEEVVGDLISLFSEVEDYWKHGIVGTHIAVHERQWSVDKTVPS